MKIPSSKAIADFHKRFPNAKSSGNFPPTKAMSDFIRPHVPQVRPIDDPDAALLAWLNHEEALFYHIEEQMFHAQTDGLQLPNGNYNYQKFVKLAQTILQRRKARAGTGFEHHLEALFVCNSVSYTRSPKKLDGTKARPDFVFPSEADYKNPDFPASRLAILGAKTTARERWRQILQEAKRVKNKHLVVWREPVTESSRKEMKQANVRLIAPKHLHKDFSGDISDLWCVKDFIAHVKSMQSK